MKKLLAWLNERRQSCRMVFRSIKLAECKEWRLDGGRLEHTTGGFFSVGGLMAEAVDKSFGTVVQPIIFQPEIGILGFVVRETAASSLEYEWLLQAKAEPGNQERVQLAPTVQATYSNYTRLHGGAKTHYLSYFTGARETKTLSDSLQSEQGTRFAVKFNRNMVQYVDDRIEYRSEMFRWTSSTELKQALLEDYAINTDARSVIAAAPWALVAAYGGPFAGNDAPTSFRALCRASYCADVDAAFHGTAVAMLEAARSQLDLNVRLCDLEELPNWTRHEDGIDSAVSGGEFTVGYYAVEAPERETSAWDQPLLKSLSVGEVVLVTQVRAGMLRVLLNLSFEAGLTGGVEFGPSYQTETRSEAMRQLKAHVDTKGSEPELSVLQSDEGGRFMKSHARYSLILLPESNEVADATHGLWVTLSELEQLCRTPKLLTNEARSCVSLLLAIA